MAFSSVLPPLLLRVDAILVLDGEGNRLAGKYYGDFLTSITSSSSRAAMAMEEESKSPSASVTVEDLRSAFERQLQGKIQGIAARSDAAEVVTLMGKTAVFCGGMAMGASPSGVGGDVRVVHVGPSSESELLLAYLCEGMYDALSNLMGGQTDRNMVLDNLELVFLLIDEHCDGGIILEVDGSKLASSVLLRDDNEPGQKEGENAPPAGAAPSGMGGMGGLRGMGLQGGDISIAQAFRQAKQQLIAGLQADGM
jgi:hypothetical protein